MNIYNYTLEELEEYFLELDEKKFKAKQVFSWLYQKKVKDFSLMSDIKKSVIDKLNSDFVIGDIELVEKQEDELVIKFLFRLNDSEHIEAVLMRHDYGNSICISSEVGCNMGCRFCESGRRKKVRALNAGEMVEQILKVEEEINERISHVVVMGIGEPFDNYDNLIKFIKIINNPFSLAIGSRHITVSTCGIVPKILEFSREGMQVNLAISLHAANDTLRNKIMPINKVYKIKDILDAVKIYIERTNRRVTIEYILLSGVNDHEGDAVELAKILKGINCYVNLIPYNETENIEFKRSEVFKIMKFYDILKKNNINTTIRREFGTKISAACGQLRSKKEEL